MTNKYKEIISDLKLILQTDDLAQIKEMLNKIKDLNDSNLEEALLSGIKYTNTSDMADFENWMLVPNDIFKVTDQEDDSISSLEGNLLYALLSLIGTSQCKTAMNLKSKVHMLNFSNLQIAELSPEIGKFTNLSSLKIDNNLLTSLPSEIGNLSELSILEIHNNQLTSLPPEIGNLTELTSFELSSNQISNLPPEIGNLTKLTHLGIFNNPIKSLPSVIRKLKNLSDLEKNFVPWLDGNVPEQLQELFAKKLEENVNGASTIKCLNLGIWGYPKAACACGKFIVCATEEVLSVWDSSNFELLWNENVSGVKMISISKNRKFFLCVSDLGFIRRYDISPEGIGKFIWESETQTFPTSLCISFDNEKFAICHQDMAGVIYLRKCSTGELIKTFGGSENDDPYEGYGYIGLAFSADGLNISAGDQDWSRVRNWNVESGELLDPLEISGVQFCSIDYSVDGKYFFTGTVETPGSVWEVDTHEEILSLEDGIGMTRIVAAHPSNGNLLVSAAAEVIHIWDIEARKQIAEFLLPDGQYSINSLSFSASGFVAAIVSYVGYVEQRKDSSFLVIGYMG
ncbi:MAG: hypothetical protein KBF99_08085 [Leptospiraceae bacterium]|nr:hypothetical protein [Leptospiraceae bacterium]